MIYSDFCRAAADSLNVVPIDMGYGDPANNKFIPKNLRRLLKEQLDAVNAGAYPDVLGDADLLSSFETYTRRDEQLAAEYHLAIITSGGRSALSTLVEICVGPHDVVLIPYPAWGGYKAIAARSDAKIVPIETTKEAGFVPSETSIRKAILDAADRYPSSRLKMLILNSPNNPTGSLYSEADIRRILSVTHDNNITCVADYTYRAIRSANTQVPSILKVAEELEKEKCTSPGDILDKVVAMQTLGKVSLTPGLRLGYVMTTNFELISKFLSHKQSTDFAGNQFVQKAFARYLNTPEQKEEFSENIRLFNERREAVVRALAKFGYVASKNNIIAPEAGFYLSFEVPQRFGETLPLSEFSTLLQKYPFIEKCIDASEYRGYFEAKGYIPSSELFVLDLISKTAVNVLPGRLFCTSRQISEEYERWVRLALIQDSPLVDEAFRRITNSGLMT